MAKNPPVKLTILSAPAPTADNKQKLSCQHSNGTVFNLYLGQQSAKVPTNFQGQYEFEIWEYEIPNSGGKTMWCGSLIPGASQNQPVAPQQAQQGPSQSAQPSNNGQDLILRQCAGKIAAVVLAASIIKYDERFQEAEFWVGYFKKGLTPNLLPAEKRFGDGAQASGGGAQTSSEPQDAPWDNS